MTPQPMLPGIPPSPARSHRRPAWEAELRRLVAILADRAARDRQRQAESLAALQDQLSDLRHRLVDLERAAGVADIARAPSRNAGLRRFAG